MLRKSILVLSILCAAILIGCSKTETTSTPTDNSNKAATTGSSNSGTSTTAPANNSGSSTTASSGDKIGVAECDDYIAKYETCIRSKVPEAARASVESTLKASRDAWKKSAETPQGKAALASICKQATDTAAASMKAYGCTW